MKDKKEEMLRLSDKALEDIELSEIPLSQICLKAKRLAMLSEDKMYEKAFTFENDGYPQELLKKLPLEMQKIAKFSNRIKTNINGETVVCDMSIEQIQGQINHYKNVPTRLSRRSDRDHLDQFTRELSERKSFVHDYLSKKNIELKFENGLNSISNNTIKRVSKQITKHLPDGTQKINSAMENLKSDNHEDWKNAETTGRRILESLAKEIEPKNSSDKYFDILKKYMKEEYKSVTPVHSKFIIDDVNDGSHSKKTTSRDEAEKIFIHICLFLDEIDWSKVDAK